MNPAQTRRTAGQPSDALRAPATIEASADACIVDGAPIICRLRFTPGEPPAIEVKEGDPAHPFVGWARRHATDILVKIAPALTLSGRTELRETWRGLPVAIVARSAAKPPSR